MPLSLSALHRDHLNYVLLIRKTCGADSTPAWETLTLQMVTGPQRDAGFWGLKRGKHGNEERGLQDRTEG
ncbi:unnamed protein product [Arctogadus glacialis]